MILYHRHDCPFCWKSRIGFAFAATEPKLISIAKGEKHPDIVKLSATATIPVFVKDDLVITQSSVLLEYINDAFADGRLLPSRPDDRAKVRNLCAYSDMVVGKALRGLVFERRDKRKEDQDAGLIRQSEEDWRHCLGFLENTVSETFMSGDFSMADCALLPRFALATRYGAAVDDKHPKLLSYWERAQKHPAYEGSLSNGEA